MKKFLALATVAFVALGAGNARASTLDVTLDSSGVESGYSYSTGGASAFSTANIDLLTTSSFVLNSNSVIVNPPTTVANQYVAPTGSIFGSNGGSYLAVEGVPAVGEATFTLAADQGSFRFTWGTIDHYNTLLLTDSHGVTYTITGTDILNAIAGSVDGSTQSDVNFIDPFGTIKTAVFESTNNSFEVANFGSSTSAVPLPASFPLFVAAFLGLFAFGRRTRKTA